MTISSLQGSPSGGVEKWRARYEEFIDRELGDEVKDAVISAVVVTWSGGADYVGGCLKAIRHAAANIAQPVEIIVVDNASRPSLCDELAGDWDRWIRFDENLDLNPARNMGVITASAEIVAFIDDDGHVAPEYFAAALPFFEDPDVVAIRGRVVAQEHPYFTALASHYDRGPEPLEDALITEGASFVRRQVYVKAGGLRDEVRGHEGIELTYRMKQAREGSRILYAPDVVLHHDYLDSWTHFMNKAVQYVHSEEDPERDEEVRNFMENYFSRSFPRHKLPLDRLVARTALRVMLLTVRNGTRMVNRTRRVVKQ